MVLRRKKAANGFQKDHQGLTNIAHTDMSTETVGQRVTHAKYSRDGTIPGIVRRLI